MTPETYAKLEKKTWNGKTPVYSESWDMYFYDAGLLVDELMDRYGDEEDGGDVWPTHEELMLVHCDPHTFHEVCEGAWLCDIHEDAGLPDEIKEALDNLNDVIRKVNAEKSFAYGCYPSNYAVADVIQEKGNND